MRVAASVCAVISDLAREGVLDKSLADEVMAARMSLAINGLPEALDCDPVPEETPEEQRL